MLVRKFFCNVNDTRALIGLCLLVLSHLGQIQDPCHIMKEKNLSSNNLTPDSLIYTIYLFVLSKYCLISDAPNEYFPVMIINPLMSGDLFYQCRLDLSNFENKFGMNQKLAKYLEESYR